MKKGFIICLAFLGLIFVCSQVFAQTAHSSNTTQPKESWEFRVVPYFWMAGISGKTAVKGIESRADVSFSDVWNSLEFGTQVHIEAWKGKWGMFLDATYLHLSDDTSLVSPDYGPVSIDVKTKEWIVEGGGFYQVCTWPLGQNRKTSLDVLGGLRYFYLYGKLDAFVPLAGIDTSPSGSKDWVDPFIGLRLMADLTKKIAFTVSGDIGGFGIGSHFTYNTQALFGYIFSPKASAWLGYRIMGINYEDGHGTNKFRYDVTMQGPIIGFGFRF